MSGKLAHCVRPLRAVGRQWTLLRHSRGFGIHSPFAYEFITRTLHESAGYYAYASLPRGKRWRTLYRVLLALRPESVRLAVGADALAASRDTAAAARMGYEPRCGLLVVADRTAALKDISDVKDSGHIILLHPTEVMRAAVKRRAAGCGYGMIFDNCRDMLIYVALRHLPQQNFKVGF
ncbi:MAG: hypothetical protein K2M79_02585 [Muribaculaceae bacterium]|nr:hypothetical protein [Muribaculaceae bacterium]